MNTTTLNDDEVRELVVARLETLPSDIRVSVGSEGDFSKTELIDHVRNGDEVGRKYVDVQMSFLRSLKEGKLYEQVYSSFEA